MMKKYSIKAGEIIFLLIMTLLISCTVKKNDLSNLSFPVEKSKILNEVKYEEKKSILAENLNSYQVNDFSAFTLYDEKFSNEIAPNSATYSGKNYLEFLGNSKEINGFKIHLYTTKESKELLKLLVLKLGKPSFEDRNVDKNMIWETSDKIYILRQGNAQIQDIETVESDLLCLNTRLTEVMVYATMNTKYSDYLKFRIKNNKKIENYPYSLYLKEEN